MVRILITGMSGTGKTSLLDELGRRGHRTVDTDYGGWGRVDGAWDETRMTDLLATQRDVVVSGTVENQSRFYDRFDYVVLLSAPLDVLLERVVSRTKQPIRAHSRSTSRDPSVHLRGRTHAAAGCDVGTRRASPG